MNRTFISGNLVAKPEEKEGKSGKFLTFKLADNITKDQVIFWECIAFQPYNTRILPHLDKGSSLIVTAEVSVPKTYQKKDGTTGVSCGCVVKDITFAPSRAKPEGEQAATPAATPAAPAPQTNMPF